MFQVISKRILASDIKRLDILAPQIAQKCHPGQFVMIGDKARGAEVALRIVEVDRHKGSIAVVFQEGDAVNKRLGTLQINDTVPRLLGPLGTPATIQKFGVVVCVASGVFIADLLPIAKALKKSGNRVIAILGASTKKELIFDPQMRIYSNKILIATDDGSYMKKGAALNALKSVLEKENVDLVYSAGSIDTLKEIAQVTQEKKVPNLVQVGMPLIDGTGDYSPCFVRVGEEWVELGVDGPEFDGHTVDFESLESHSIAFNFERQNGCNQKSPSDLKKKEKKTLKKLLSGFHRSQP